MWEVFYPVKTPKKYNEDSIEEEIVLYVNGFIESLVKIDFMPELGGDYFKYELEEKVSKMYQGRSMAPLVIYRQLLRELEVDVDKVEKYLKNGVNFN